MSKFSKPIARLIILTLFGSIFVATSRHEARVEGALVASARVTQAGSIDSLIITSALSHNALLASVKHSKSRTFTFYQNFVIICFTILLLLDCSLSTSFTGIKLKTETSNVRRKYDNTTYNAILDGEIALPCNITAPSFDDGVSLVLWYRDDIASPIYTVDARHSSSLEGAQHFLHTDIFDKRATFNLSYPLSFLRIKPVKSSDGGDYRCRVDFRRARTVNRILKLTVIVPTSNVVIYDQNFSKVDKVAGPFEEDSTQNLICDSDKGNPLPAVHWWRGSHLLDTDYFVVNNSIARNVLTLANLTRDDLFRSLTCQARNTNLTVPVSRTITLDLYLKPREIRIITPLRNISSENVVELACQCSGSKPSAKIRWEKDKQQLEAFSETVSEDGLTTTSFVSFVPSIDDNGKNIICTGFNPKLSTKHSIEDKWPINIYYSPLLSLIMGSDSHSQDIVEGSNVYFECNVKANPSVTSVGWMLNGQLLNSEAFIGVEMRNASLLITNVNHDHYGHYQCLASNSLGSTTSEFVFLDVKYAPHCQQLKPTLVGVALEESVQIDCQVLANPSDVSFEWRLVSSVGGKSSQLRYLSDGLRSVAKFTATHEEDYGELRCWATNRIGPQETPCVYHIIKAEPPSQPHNCSIVNKTAHSITLECLPGYSGGLEQIFLLQVYSLNPNRLLKNLSNSEIPHFSIDDLPSGYIFKLVIYSVNRKGKSKSIEITGSTTEPSPWKSAQFEASDLYTSLGSVLLLLALAILATLAVVTLLVLLVRRIRRKCKSKVRTSVVCSEKVHLPPKSIMKKRVAVCKPPEPGETIEINDLTTFKPDYHCNERLETCATDLSSTAAFSQPYFVPLPEFTLNELHPREQQQPPGSTVEMNLLSSYDLCPPIHIIDMPSSNLCPCDSSSQARVELRNRSLNL